MKPLTRIAAVGAAATALLLGSAAASFAQSTTIDDKRYDVVFSDNGQRVTKTGSYAEKIAARNIDVDKLKVTHGKDFVSLTFDMHRLAGPDTSWVEAVIDVPGGNVDNFYLGAAANGEGGVYASSSPQGEGTYCSAESSTRRIRGTSKTGADGFLKIQVPRACFGNPSKVRVQSAGFHDDRDAARIQSDRQLAKVVAASTNEGYIDIISSKYFLKAQLTSWLKRN